MPAYRTVLDDEGVASVAAVTFVGDEEEVAAQLRRFAEAGVTEFVGFLYRGPDAVARSTTLLTGVRL